MTQWFQTNQLAFAKCPTLDSLMISLLPWYDATCSQHQALPQIHSVPLLNVTDHSRSTLPRYRIHPPSFLQRPVCWRHCGPFQIIRCIFLFICFPSAWFIHTQKFLPRLFASVCSRLRITRVFITCTAFSTDTVLLAVLYSCFRGSGTAMLQTCMFSQWILNWWHPVPWGPLQDLHFHCHIHRCSGRHVVFILSLCLGVFLSPNFYSLYPFDVQRCFLIIYYLHHFTVAVFSSLYFRFLPDYNRLNR